MTNDINPTSDDDLEDVEDVEGHKRPKSYVVPTDDDAEDDVEGHARPKNV